MRFSVEPPPGVKTMIESTGVSPTGLDYLTKTLYSYKNHNGKDKEKKTTPNTSWLP